MDTQRPNHPLQRLTRPSRRGCNRTPSWAGSLSLGRYGVMRTRKQKIITMICLTALVGVVAWALCSSPAPTVSLQVFGYETNTIDEPGIFTSHQYFCAVVR